MKVFCDASNMHMGGGKKLISDFINSAKEFSEIDFVIFIDPRLNLKNIKFRNIKFIIVSKFVRIFICFYINLKVNKKDHIIYLGNIPPILGSKCVSTLYLGNTYLINNSSTKGFKIKARTRICLERFMFYLFKANVDEIIIQTKSMQELLNKKIKEKTKVKIFPYFNFNHINFKKNINKIYDFIYVASDEPHKNHINLLKSWCELARQKIYPSLCLVLPSGSFLEDKIKSIKLNDKLIKIEIKNNLSYKKTMFYLKSSNALIFPSYFESFGLPLLEAKYLNIDIIASEKDFVRDIVDPQETFDPRSYNSITRAIKRYLNIDEPKANVKSAKEFILYFLKNK